MEDTYQKLFLTLEKECPLIKTILSCSPHCNNHEDLCEDLIFMKLVEVVSRGIIMKKEWGFIRETEEKAKKAGRDKDTGVIRTGLEKYLEVIFPEVDDWIHDQRVPDLRDSNGKKRAIRPDYRSEKLKMIVEFDGLQHYQKPDNIKNDEEKTKIYKENGYKVVRIPYFIQLTNDVVKSLFNVDVKEELFDENIPSLGPKGENTPAYLCHRGVMRMAREFAKFPQQYKVNIDYLKEQNNQYLIEYELLEEEYNNIIETNNE